MVIGIFKVALLLRDTHLFMWKSLEILSVFIALTVKQIFWKTQALFKKLGYLLLVESTKTGNAAFLYKTALSVGKKPMFIQIEWEVQNEPITKNDVLPVTVSFFRKFVSF